MNTNPQTVEMVLDRSKLTKLRTVLQDDYDDALESFLKQAEIYITAIRTAISDRRPDDAMGIAHKLKSSSGLYGFTKVSRLSNSIERSTMIYQDQSMMALYNELAEAFHEAVTELRKDPQ